jgi:hypothetical protein
MPFNLNEEGHRPPAPMLPLLLTLPSLPDAQDDNKDGSKGRRRDRLERMIEGVVMGDCGAQQCVGVGGLVQLFLPIFFFGAGDLIFRSIKTPQKTDRR